MKTAIKSIDIGPEKLIALLRGRAAELDLQVDGDEELLESVLQHDVEIPEPDEAECRRYYTLHADALQQGDMVEVDHILFAVTPTTPIDALRARAEGTLNTLLVHPDEFGGLASTLSNCPSGQLGGNLGQLTREQCVPEFWQALIEHGQPGLLPRLVRTRFGLHIVRIARIAHGQLPPFAALHARIAQVLNQQSLVRALHLYIEVLTQQQNPGYVSAESRNYPNRKA